MNAAVADVLAALAGAQAQAPEAGATLAVQARVVGDMIDRAAQQHGTAWKDPSAYEPYLDGYGFFLAAQARAEKALPALEAAGKRDVAERMRTALRTLARAYPGPLRPEGGRSPVDNGALLAEASRVKLMAGALR